MDDFYAARTDNIPALPWPNIAPPFIVTSFVATLVVSDGRFSLLPAWDAGVYSLFFQRFSEPIGVVAAISKQPIYLWQAANEDPHADVIADLPGSHKEVQWAPLSTPPGALGVRDTGLGLGFAN